MEMDAASHNRFAFSLSHNTTVLPFEAFSPAPDQHGGAGGDPAMLPAERPKLEDFLGGCGRESSSGETAVAETGASSGGYDPHIMRRIAAGFVQGFAAEHLDSATVAAAVETAKPRGLAEPFGQRTSIYRGVTKHRWTGRYEAHLWDNGCLRDGQRRKGRQVYLGGYDREEKAARAYDLAALKYWGSNTTTNFPVSNYEEELKEMNNATRQEFVASLRRNSSGFSRGASMYRGVTRHHHHGRWQARIGRVAGNKDLYLGTFSTQEEAAEAYDIAAIKFRGLNAVTNFNMSRYDVERILNSNLPIGSGVSGKTLKASEYSSSAAFTSNAWHQISGKDSSSAMTSKQEEEDCWSSSLALHPQQQQRHDQQQRNQTTLGFEVLGSGVSMDFSTAAASVGGVGRGRVGTVDVWDAGRMAQLQQEQQSPSGCSSVPRAAPNIAMVGTNRVGGAYCGSLTCNPFMGWINDANGLSE